MTITVKMLRDLGACEGQIGLFIMRFGEQVTTTPETDWRGFDLDWIAGNLLSLLPSLAQKEYWEVHDKASREYWAASGNACMRFGYTDQYQDEVRIAYADYLNKIGPVLVAILSRGA